MSAVALFIFPAAMALAASSDLLTMRISNKLVIALTVAFFIVALAISMPLEQLAMHVLCAFVVLAVAFGLFALRLIGGGDAKLAAATTLWLGFGTTLPYLAYTALFGGVLTILILVIRGIPLHPALGKMEWLARLHNKRSGIPYGIAMAVAGIMVYWNSAIFERLAA
ncbi:prepilin peptidase CpaA [Devosia crocina]|uniref:Prepilin peptidase CpaA n=1 Tax=Devosia crocina TaxID=429728 RepID=A0A1I7NPI8_9HYPH|nr:prepilin peptidase [Devosia crocina]SFV36607.1 prepilin peptidase CpaA [Devosia crocina]